MDQVALIAFGANRPSPAGDPVETVRAALAGLAASQGLCLRAASRLFRTPAFPQGSGPDFVNAAAAFDCSLEPAALLALLHRVEAEHGRRRDIRWGARSLDLDLLALGDAVLPDTETWRHWHDLTPDRQTLEAPKLLILPHPRLQDRAFVLVPLAEIAPDWRHPVLGLTVTGMRDRLPPEDLAGVTPLPG
ncbi:2-amino-4-hydroxy-6-hydroxymethyldihydropteridine diphosphokinase [Marimonas arenosa]|uniref:2-amino-4-hydroxy-6-hydroxymethyldihydropteridine pyrophosphokinase n=1 Tax=Marimonas arenosa TaxID=1795305 RepID=A0AAE4B6S3_9RHOB|nr:2-amino-4-hydroxy-6-hydroxymethyldihydropteridine diphosphokinase [Marimonas arenosa]MDQ2090741.1 2-amino-4-hydroxy-6-hydroxymethyldihydropteridine diphosphokinase [Marimonas arenosa]